MSETTLNVKQIAARWHCTETTVYRYIHRGLLPNAVQFVVGGDYKIPEDDVIALERSRKVGNIS